MNRRTAVRNLALVVGAAVVLPACLSEAKKEELASVPLKHLKVSAEQEKLLAEVCETMLPRTDTPGAKELGIHRHVLTMVDACCPKLERQTFMRGLTRLEALAMEQFKQSFMACTPVQRQALLQRMAPQPNPAQPKLPPSFYSTVRRLTVDGYTRSKYFLTTHVVYELVPGRYNGYFPTKDLDFAHPSHG
jgi:hypothetical protein